MPTFDIPKTPWELVARQRNIWRRLWNREYDLANPVISINWPYEFDSAIGKIKDFSYMTEAVRRINDPEFDVFCQLESVRHQIECLEASTEVGHVLANLPAFDMLHFGTAPLATAFGAQMILREGLQPAFEPAVHTPEEVMRLKKPDLFRDGICPQILERIQYYNKATRGEVILTPCDTGGPWSIATSIWHYEDMLDAIYTAPEVVHYLLDMVTESIIEWYNIQETYIGRWGRAHTSFSSPFFPRGIGIGDDCMVTVSPATWEEFFMPYNNRLSREYGRMIIYHCCMRYDGHFESIAKTDGFIGFDGQPDHNDFSKIAATLEKHRAIWTRQCGPGDMDFIRLLAGKAGMLFAVNGYDRADAIRRAKVFIADLADPERMRWSSTYVRRWNVSKLLPPTDIATVTGVRLADPLDWEIWPANSLANGSSFFNLHDKYRQDGLVYAANRFMVEKDGRWILYLGNDGPARVFVDGKAVLTEIKLANPASPKRCQVEVALAAGEHEIVVAFDIDNGRGWGFYFSFEVPEADRNTVGPLFPTPVL